MNQDPFKVNKSSLLSKQARRKVAGAVFGTGLALGATGGALATHAVDTANQRSRVGAAIEAAKPYCELPVTIEGISAAESAVYVAPETAEVSIIGPNGLVFNPNMNAASDFGFNLPKTDLIAIKNVGAVVCQEVGEEPGIYHGQRTLSTPYLTPDLNLNSVGN